MITFIIGFALGGALGILTMCLVAVNTADGPKTDEPPE